MAIRLSRLLVPVDFSAGSSAALRYAGELAANAGAALHLLHVVEEPPLSGTWVDSMAATLDVLREERLDAARRRLARLTAALPGMPRTVEVTIGLAAEAIVRVAARERADLIVMGTHGRSGMARLLMGSVTEHVVRMAPCPVLTIRRRQARRARPRVRAA